MLTNIVAILILIMFTFIIGIGIWAGIQIRKVGLLKALLLDKWALGILTGLFIVQFLVDAIALLAGVEWAVPATRYTIYLWLVYLWLYGLIGILG